MDWASFSLGIVAGIAIGVVSGIILYEYTSRRERSQEEKSARRQWNTDLGWELVNFCEEWNEFKGCLTPSVELRTELIAHAREIKQRSAQAFIEPSHRRSIKKSIHIFLKQAKKLSGTDDQTWSNHVMEEVDAVCNNLRRLSNRLRK